MLLILRTVQKCAEEDWKGRDVVIFIYLGKDSWAASSNTTRLATTFVNNLNRLSFLN